MQDNIPPHPDSIERAFILWLIPVFNAILGIVCLVYCVILGEQTMINGGMLFLSYIVLITAGVFILHRCKDFFLKVYQIKKITRGDFIFLSAITFGSIPLCVFLLLNKTFADRQEFEYNSRIIEKRLTRRKIASGIYDNRVATSYNFEDEQLSEDFIPSPATDTAQFVLIRYRHGLFGYSVVTGLQLN